MMSPIVGLVIIGCVYYYFMSLTRKCDLLSTKLDILINSMNVDFGFSRSTEAKIKSFLEEGKEAQAIGLIMCDLSIERNDAEFILSVLRRPKNRE